jgi:hypothetical protein
MRVERRAARGSECATMSAASEAPSLAVGSVVALSMGLTAALLAGLSAELTVARAAGLPEELTVARPRVRPRHFVTRHVDLGVERDAASDRGAGSSKSDAKVEASRVGTSSRRVWYWDLPVRCKLTSEGEACQWSRAEPRAAARRGSAAAS